MRRSILAVAVSFIVLFGIVSVNHAAEKIRMSVSGSYNMIFLAAGVAQHKGFFKDEGLDADIVVMTAPASLAALIEWRHRLHAAHRFGDSRRHSRPARRASSPA